VGVLASRKLSIRAVDGLAERGGLPTHEREIAVDPLKVVARGTGALGRTLSRAGGFGDLLPGPPEVRGDPTSLPLAFAPLLREAGRGRGELLVSFEKRALLVAEAQLVALADEMRAFGLDACGPRFGQGDARVRRLLLRGARAVGGLARRARRNRGLFVDARAPLAKVRELCRESGEGSPGALVLRTDRGKTRFKPRDALARRRFNRCRIRRADAAKLFLLPRRAQILVRAGGRRLALGDVVGQAIDLLVDARDPRREIGALIGRRAERGLVPAQRATA